MANTLTNLIPSMFAAADTVSREMVGMIPAVQKNSSAEEVAKDQVITYPIVGAATAADIVAAATGPDPSDTSVGNGSMSITKSRGVTFYWTGEEQKGLGNGYGSILADQFAQAMRTLTNEVEADLAALYKYASRAYGTAGTTPFASDLSDPANMLRIMKDNGAPTGDLQMVINTTAGAKLRTLAQLTKANEAGSDQLRANGVLLDLHSFKIRESAQIKAHTKGTGASYVTSGSTAPGVTDIALVTGTGTVLAGDVATFAADANNKYVVNTGVAAPGTISLGKPGAIVTIATANALTVGNSYAANMAFARSAIHLLTRVPAMPEGGDAADDVYLLTDPVSGIVYQIVLYRQRRRIAIEVGLAWGVKAVNSEHIALLLG